MSTSHRGKKGKPKFKIVGGTATRHSDFTPEERRYFADLHKILDEIFEKASKEYNWSWNQLAAHSNLGYQTVANLGDRVTHYPRFYTVFKLAASVGWKLSLAEGQKRAARPATATA